MLFGKKKRMIDVGELHRRGIVRLPPKKEVVIPTDKNGFVDISSESKKSSTPTKKTNTEFFGFSSAKSSTSDSFSTEAEGYSKKEVDSKMIDLDNKIYKLEQRVELLERKLDVNKPSVNEGGMIGW